VDAIQPTDNTESVNLGGEYSLREWAFLRAGYRHLFLQDSEEGLTLGAGLNLNTVLKLPFRLDYAFADFGRLNSIQCFSLAVQL